MKHFIYFTFFMLFFVAGCADDNTVGNHDIEQTPQYNSSYESVIKPTNELGLSLLDKVDPDDEQNVFISPASAFIALLLAYNGAEGETKEELSEAMSISGLTIEEVNEATHSYVSMLKNDRKGIELSMANSLWLNERFHLDKDYQERVVQYYGAKIAEIDITDDYSAEKINNWVSEATNDKIDDIVEAPLHPNLVSFLINAIYFNGKWTHKFEEENTTSLLFYSPDREREVPFMVQEEELEYMENDAIQAVKLPYGKGEMSMEIILPKEDIELMELIKELTIDEWEGWQNEFQEKEGTIHLPKFKLEYETILNSALEQLGISAAFDEKEADFPHMIEEEDPLYIEQIKQKAFIEVSEEGTEAAAATSVEMRTTSAILDDQFSMEVNRPFLFTIIDEETEAIIFLGYISNPEQ